MVTTQMQYASYATEVSPDIWEVLNGIDLEGNDNSDWIMDELRDLGAEDIEWNGHFGMCVFFSLEVQSGINNKLIKIEQYLENFSD